MTLPEPFASVHADDLLLDSLAARREPAGGTPDPAADALLRLARAADEATLGTCAAATQPTGIDSATGLPGREASTAPARSTGRRHAVIASRLLVAAAASVALGLVPAAHDNRPPLPSPVLPAAPVALVRAQALVAQAQELVSPPDAEPTTAALDRAAALLAQASDVLDGVRDPVGGTLGVDAVRARIAGVAGVLAVARHRLESPAGVVEPLHGDDAGTPTAPAAADRGSARGGGTTVGAAPGGTRTPGRGSRPDERAESHESEGAGDSGPTRTGGSASGSSGGHGESESSGAERPTDTEHSGDRVGDDGPESGDASGTSSQPSTTRDRSGSGAGSGEGSHDGSDDGATEPGSGADDGHESD